MSFKFPAFCNHCLTKLLLNSISIKFDFGLLENGFDLYLLLLAIKSLSFNTASVPRNDLPLSYIGANL